MYRERKAVRPGADDDGIGVAHDSNFSANTVGARDLRRVVRINCGRALTPRWISESAWTIAGIGSDLSITTSTQCAACCLLHARQRCRSARGARETIPCANKIAFRVNWSQKTNGDSFSTCALATASLRASV